MTQEITMVQDAEGVVYFKGHDVATVLGYINSRDALHKHVDDEDKLKLEEITKFVR